ncbi:AraC family transcriptional regulator [Chitinophaga sp. 212800010-3]|uniref:AraC family transcriptional regulator n=1 Tax=unclassified Chitinophaga TaxID=2619133 RepID=UPI002DEC3EB7|nr:HTH araC/xylS-type domain-containing protein [Chitinophaga sp. 212800010-3]
MASHSYPKVYLYRRVVQAKLFIDHHFADDIDLNNISDEAYFSKFHFIRLFKKIYGKTPHQYLIWVRLEKAMELLKYGSTVSEACYAVGFESVGSFSALFKRTTGVSPSTFQEAQQQIKKQISRAPLNFVPGCFIYQYNLTENSNFGETV